MKHSRVVVYSGHYGSGKSALAVDYALRMANIDKSIVLYDLDIVNPYFRSADSRAELEKSGVRVVSSAYANTNADTPALPAEAYALTQNRELYAVVDLGGDDRGAMAMGRYSDSLKAENDYAMLFVFNAYRPLTRTARAAYDVLREIESASRMRFCAVVNNSNLGDETTEETVLRSLQTAEELSELAGLSVLHTSVREDLYNSLKSKVPSPLAVTLRHKWEL